MGGGKGGYSSYSAPEPPKLTAEQKREQERKQAIEQTRGELNYHEDRSRQLIKDKDAILQQLPKRDYDRFKTLPKKDKDDILQQLRAVDYNRFQRLEEDEEKTEKAIRAAEKKLEKLEEKNGRKKNTSKRS